MELLQSFMQDNKEEPPKRKAIDGCDKRCSNLFEMHFRGLLALVPFIAFFYYISKQADHNFQIIWGILFWYFLTVPVSIPVTATIPIFLFPLTGVISTPDITSCYFNVNIAMFLIAGMLFLLLNNSGADRSISLRLLSFGSECQFTRDWLIWKSCLAAYFLSIFSNRFIVTSSLTQYITSIFEELEALNDNTHLEEFRYVINSAIHTSATIGSLTFATGAYTTMIMKTILEEYGGNHDENSINFYQYICFAIPTTMIMLILNVFYHMFLINWVVVKPVGPSGLLRMKNYFKHQRKLRSNLPYCYEMLSMIFLLIALFMITLRSSHWIKKIANSQEGYRTWIDTVSDIVDLVNDFTLTALFVIIMHAIPKSLGFAMIVDSNNSELRRLKPESGILWWRYVDQNTNYGYFLVFGCGVALMKAAESSKIALSIGNSTDGFLNNLDKSTGIFILILISALMCNIMNGAAACTLLLPIVLQMVKHSSSAMWKTEIRVVALAVGVSTSFGFMSPFACTPAYFCHHAGRVPKLKMAKYSSFTVLMCSMVTWAMLVYWAPTVIYPMKIPIRVELLDFTTIPLAPFRFIDMEGGLLRFKVKSGTHVVVSLTTNPPDNHRNIILVIIGGWSNKMSGIRKHYIGVVQKLTNTPNILDETEFRKFLITWDEGQINVGRQDENNSFITYVDPQPFPISVVGFRSGKGTAAIWQVEASKQGKGQNEGLNSPSRGYHGDVPAGGVKNSAGLGSFSRS